MRSPPLTVLLFGVALTACLQLWAHPVRAETDVMLLLEVPAPEMPISKVGISEIPVSEVPDEIMQFDIAAVDIAPAQEIAPGNMADAPAPAPAVVRPTPAAVDPVVVSNAPVVSVAAATATKERKWAIAKSAQQIALARGLHEKNQKISDPSFIVEARTLPNPSLIVERPRPIKSRPVEIVGVSPKSIQVEVSKGELIRLSAPAKTVFVADPDVADIQVKSPQLIYLLAKKPGETTLFAVGAGDRILLRSHVTVSHNKSRIQKAFRQLLPTEDITVTSLDGILVLSGTVSSPGAAEDARRLAARLVENENDLINRLGVSAANQVHLRVRVAEVSRDILKRFGVNWDAVFSVGNFIAGFATGLPVAAAAGAVLTRNNATNSLVGGFRSSSVDINGVVDALDDEGLISILAEPNLTALSGKTATFLAGGEFPILIPENDRITVDFKEFGVSLAFTPNLISQNRISLNVRPEVSQLSNTGAVELAGFTIPALTTRRAETTVELGSGQSFVIAGLLQNNLTHDISKFPGLGDVPVLGSLFSSDSFRRNESELVIIVTPYVVRPVATAQLRSPTDGMAPPTDNDRMFRKLNRGSALQDNTSPPRGVSGQRLIGPVGFELE